jgi:hypothetical protein
LSQDHAGVLDEGMQLQLLETTAKDGNVWANLVNECNRGIAKALLGMTDLAEPTRVGAYAAVETRKGATVDARVLKDERALAMTWERDLIEPAVRLNADRWGGIIPPIPRLRWSIAARRQALDPVGVLSMTVDEVRSSMGREPLGGILGAQPWRDYAAGKSPVDPSAVSTEQPVADTALNGAQIASLIQIIGEVAAGRIPRETGVQIIAASFPTIAAQAESIMGEVGRSFVPRVAEVAP